MKAKNIILCLAMAVLIVSPAFAQELSFPFYVYCDATSPLNHGAPSGWMGDFRDVIINLNCKESPKDGDSCIEITYTAEGSKYAYWAGMFWQNPANNAGYIDGGIDLTGARKLTFWARGKEGGEVIDAFKLGGTLGAYPDTDSIGIYDVMLSSEWTQYEIDLTGCDLTYISGVFCWVANRYANPEGFKIYIDEIRIEK
ncbi:MAG: hypothetical protein JW928_08895 [Candidatus Aureabacteria bacterium]|nr:hypothetical protein [Candidatus Auribacterota bacterium]